MTYIYIPIHPDKVAIRENNGKDKNGMDEFVTFGPFLQDDCFCIENSSCHNKTGKGKKVSIGEFLLFRPKKEIPVVWVVEAKTGSPSKASKKEPREPEESKFKFAFDEFIEEIRIKLTNSFLLTISACLGRHSIDCFNTLPKTFQQLDFTKTDFYFVLVIPKHPDDWLKDIQYELNQAMQPLIKSWNLSAISVKVWNEQLAKDNGLITP